MGCTTATLRVLSFILNTVCCLFGITELAVNAFMLHEYSTSEIAQGPCIMGIVLGSLMFLASIVGCFGACRSSVCTTWVYAGALVLLVIAHMTAFFLLSVDFGRLAEETINAAWNGQLIDPNAMETYEQEYKCCGKTGPNDYSDSGLIVPPSCYKNNDIVPQNLYTDGCINQLRVAYLNLGSFDLIADWTIVAVLGAGVVVSGLLAVTIRNEERRRSGY